MAVLTTVIPVYNGEKYLKTTLDCLARQSRKPDRVVVLDNCSTDKTKEIALGYTGLPIEFIQNEKNLGLFGNMNRALQFASQTEYLHILTADDIVLPEFFDTLLSALEQCPTPSLCYSRFELIDAEGNKLPPWWFIDYKDNGAPNRKVPLRELLNKQAMMQTVLMPAAIIKTGYQPLKCAFNESMPQVADVVFYADLATQCKEIIEVRQILCQYRIHPQNTTARNLERLQALAQDEWRAMRHIASLFPRPFIQQAFYLAKLKVLFSARIEVCIKQSGIIDPNKISEIRKILRDNAGLLFWIIGYLAVKTRNFYWRLTGKSHLGPYGKTN